MPQLRLCISLSGLTQPRFFEREISCAGLSIEDLHSALDEAAQAFNAKLTEALELKRQTGEAARQRAA